MKQRRKTDNDRLCVYWSELCENQWTLSEIGRRSVGWFLQHLPAHEVEFSMRLSAERVPSENIEGRFRYFCAVCHNKINQLTNVRIG